MWAQLSFVLSHITRLTDRPTERRTDSFLVARPPIMYLSLSSHANSVRLQYTSYLFSESLTPL